MQSVPQIPQPSSLISLMGTVVPQPPPLTGNVDPTKIEEIRRTIYVGNLNSSVCRLVVPTNVFVSYVCACALSFVQQLTAEQVLTFFQPCGEIKYVRMAGDETQPTRYVERGREGERERGGGGGGGRILNLCTCVT